MCVEKDQGELKRKACHKKGNAQEISKSGMIQTRKN